MCALQVSTNGIITFGSPLFESEPEAFPPDDTDTFWTYIIAPFWADFDTTMGGAASWEIHDREHSSSLMAMVDTFIAEEYGDQNFEGSWMLVAFWENMQPSGQTEVTNKISFYNGRAKKWVAYSVQLLMKIFWGSTYYFEGVGLVVSRLSKAISPTIRP